MEMMEARGDLRSIPVVPRGGALFWPAAAQEQMRALSPGPDVSRVASGALHDLRQALALPALPAPPRSRRSPSSTTSSCGPTRGTGSPMCSPASSSASRSCSRTTTPAPGPRSGSASWPPRTRASCSWARSPPPCSSACPPPPAPTNNVR
ncbi:hypothetical protein VPH35_068333 [Triticum aestivum]